MNDEAAFIRQICLTPDDDAPRLIYADWLDENDHPERAEFIRVQIRLAELRQEEPSNEQIQRMDEVGSLAWRQRDLWAKRTLLTEIASSTSVYMSLGRSVHESHLAPDKMSALIRRGFVDEIRCTLAEFMRHAQTIALAHPVRKWVLTDVPISDDGRFVISGYPALGMIEHRYRHVVDPRSYNILFTYDRGEPYRSMLREAPFARSEPRAEFHFYGGHDAAATALQQWLYHAAREKLLASIPQPVPV